MRVCRYVVSPARSASSSGSSRRCSSNCSSSHDSSISSNSRHSSRSSDTEAAAAKNSSTSAARARTFLDVDVQQVLALVLEGVVPVAHDAVVPHLRAGERAGAQGEPARRTQNPCVGTGARTPRTTPRSETHSRRRARLATHTRIHRRSDTVETPRTRTTHARKSADASATARRTVGTRKRCATSSSALKSRPCWMPTHSTSWYLCIVCRDGRTPTQRFFVETTQERKKNPSSPAPWALFTHECTIALHAL